MRRKGPIHVVDDDDAARPSLEMMLTAAGYEVYSHPSAESFLTQCRDYTGCIVVDVGMSGIDGVSLARHLRDEQRELPIVLISGQADVKMAVAAMRAGAADFLEQPFHVDELLKAIEDALAGRTGRSASCDGMQRARRRLQGLTPCERGMAVVLIGEAFRDDHAARQYLGLALQNCVLPPETLLPMRKWVQAIYLTDAGRLKAGAKHLAHLLDIPSSLAREVVRHISTMDGLDIIAKAAAPSLSASS